MVYKFLDILLLVLVLDLDSIKPPRYSGAMDNWTNFVAICLWGDLGKERQNFDVKHENTVASILDAAKCPAGAQFVKNFCLFVDKSLPSSLFWASLMLE